MTLRIEFNADLAAFHANGSQALHELARKTEVLLRLENGTVEFSCQSGSVIATATLTGKRDNLIVLEKSYHQATFQPLGEMGLSVAHMTLRVVEKETETQAMIGVQQVWTGNIDMCVDMCADMRHVCGHETCVWICLSRSCRHMYGHI